MRTLLGIGTLVATSNAGRGGLCARATSAISAAARMLLTRRAAHQMVNTASARRLPFVTMVGSSITLDPIIFPRIPRDDTD